MSVPPILLAPLKIIADLEHSRDAMASDDLPHSIRIRSRSDCDRFNLSVKMIDTLAVRGNHYNNKQYKEQGSDFSLSCSGQSLVHGNQCNRCFDKLNNGCMKLFESISIHCAITLTSWNSCYLCLECRFYTYHP